MNIQNFDLNLLLALDALLTEKHVTRAAARIGLSQPAMSNALARLRDLLDDPLLVRTNRGMVPTPRAERLQEPLRHALQAIQRALSDAEAFSPGASRATFELMTSDAIGMLLLPRLTAALRDTAPGVALRVHAAVENEPWDSLESGRVHLVAGVYEDVPAGVRSETLYEEQFVCLVRRDHPHVGECLELAEYVALPHVLISTSRSGLAASPVDPVLEGQGLTRQVALWLPNFLLAPFIVAQSDYVITFPSRLAAYFAAFLPLRTVRPPLELRGYAIRLYWHERLDREPGQRWLRGQVRAAADALEPARAGLPGRAAKARGGLAGGRQASMRRP